MLDQIQIGILTYLHRAAYEGDVAALDALVAAGADIEARCDAAHDHGPFYEGLTPLMLAAASDRDTYDAVVRLLNLGADPTAVSAGEITALWYAAGSRDSNRLKALIEAGCNIHEHAHNGRTVLGEAAGEGNEAIVKVLLDLGAQPQPVGTPPAYHPPLFLSGQAAASLAESMQKYRVESWPYYLIPLFLAAESGNANCVRLLIAAGADPNFRDDQNGTALMHAASAEVVEALIEAECAIDSRDTFDQNTLDRLLADELFDAAKALIRAGANLEEQDRYGRTPLLRLCGCYTVTARAVELLIDAGAELHVQTEGFGSALHQAAQLYCGDRRDILGGIVRLLVRAGLPVDTRDSAGNTALHKAVDDEGVDLSAIGALLESGADPNAENGCGMTPLMIAAAFSYREETNEVITMLLNSGADLDQMSSDGMTTIDYASGNVERWENIVSDSKTQVDSVMSEILESVGINPDERRRAALESTRSVEQMLRNAAEGKA